LLLDMSVNTKLVKFGLSSALVAALAAFASLVPAQNTSTSASAPVAKTAKASADKTAADKWDNLTPAQKTALQPLNASWVSLPDGQKRKWLAVSANFSQFSAQDKKTLHGRMTEWASLSAKQREQARINFAQTNKLTATDKQAKWESYKALPPETKQALADINVAPKPTGAATAAKPVAKDKLVASTPKTEKSTAR
jgi:Protein of unknown function (DUF3106)